MRSPPRTRAHETHEARETHPQPGPAPVAQYVIADRGKTDRGEHPTTDNGSTQDQAECCDTRMILARLLMQGAEVDPDACRFLLVKGPCHEEESDRRFGLPCRGASE